MSDDRQQISTHYTRIGHSPQCGAFPPALSSTTCSSPYEGECLSGRFQSSVQDGMTAPPSRSHSQSASSLNRPTDVAAPEAEGGEGSLAVSAAQSVSPCSGTAVTQAKEAAKKRQKEYLKFSKKQLLFTYCTEVRARGGRGNSAAGTPVLYPSEQTAEREERGDLPKMQSVICNCKQKGAAIIQCSL